MGWVVQYRETPEGVLRWKGVKEVVVIRQGGNFLRLVYLPCGRSNCTKCPHGPYWYFGYTHRRKVRQIYIGKSLMNDRILRKPEMYAHVQEAMKEVGVPAVGKDAERHFQGTGGETGNGR